MLNSAPFPEAEIASIENTPFQHEVDFFWEAPEHFNTSFTADGSSLPSLGHSSIISDTLSWQDVASGQEPGEATGQMFSDPLLELSSPSPSQDLPLLSDKAFQEMYCEDPFMGWGTKRSSQICEDYGWVLSHVGTL